MTAGLGEGEEPVIVATDSSPNVSAVGTASNEAGLAVAPFGWTPQEDKRVVPPVSQEAGGRVAPMEPDTILDCHLRSVGGSTTRLKLYLYPVVALSTSPRLRADLFDSDRLISSESFGAGWRTPVSQAQVVPYPTGRAIDIVRVGSQPDAGVQYYGLTSGRRVCLIRLEAGNGLLLPNSYSILSHAVGPVRASVAAESLLQELRSTNPCDVLAALVWLGGRHNSDEVAPQNRLLLEDPAIGKSIARLLKAQRIREAIQRLSTSGDEWISDAAAGALVVSGESAEGNETQDHGPHRSGMDPGSPR